MVCLVCPDRATCRDRGACRDQRGHLVLIKTQGVGKSEDLLRNSSIWRLFGPFGWSLNHGADDAPEPNGAPRE